MAEDRYWEAVGTYRCIDGRCQQRKFRHRDRSDRIAARGTADRIGHTAYITEHMAEDRYWEAVGTYRCIDGRCQQRKFRHRDRSDRIAARGTADRIGHTAYISEQIAEDRYWEAVGTYRCIDGRCQQRKFRHRDRSDRIAARGT